MALDRAFWLRLMIKLDRLAAWTLLVVMLLFAISGYGMTKRLFDPGIARKLHMAWLGGVGLVAFVVHTSWAIHMAFKRWGWWNRFTKTVLILAYLALVSAFVYVDRFSGSHAGTPPKAASAAQETGVTDEAPQKVFTTEELGAFDGKEGRAAFVAVDGIVYDLSSVFRNGKHAGHVAGKDLSEAFRSEHSAETLAGFKAVGVLSIQ